MKVRSKLNFHKTPAVKKIFFFFSFFVCLEQWKQTCLVITLIMFERRMKPDPFYLFPLSSLRFIKNIIFIWYFCIFLSESFSMRWEKEPWTDCWSLSHTQKCSPGTHVKENWANGCKFQNSCFNFAVPLQLQKMSNFTEVKKNQWCYWCAPAEVYVAF